MIDFLATKEEDNLVLKAENYYSGMMFMNQLIKNFSKENTGAKNALLYAPVHIRCLQYCYHLGNYYDIDINIKIDNGFSF